MATQFVYEYNFEEQIEDVYDAIVRWLRSNPGRIKSTTPPTDILATHGSHRTVSGWKASAKKKLHFVLERTDRGTRVRVTVSPTPLNEPDIDEMREQARINWGLMLEEIWQRLGDSHSRGRSSDLRVKAEEVRESSFGRANAMIRIGGFGSVIALLVVLALVIAIEDWYDLLEENPLYELGIVAFVCLVFGGFLTMLLSGVFLRAANRRKRQG